MRSRRRRHVAETARLTFTWIVGANVHNVTTQSAKPCTVFRWLIAFEHYDFINAQRQHNQITDSQTPSETSASTVELPWLHRERKEKHNMHSVIRMNEREKLESEMVNLAR